MVTKNKVLLNTLVGLITPSVVNEIESYDFLLVILIDQRESYVIFKQ